MDEELERQLDEFRKRLKWKVLGRGAAEGLWEKDMAGWTRANDKRRERIYGVWAEELLDDLRDIFK